MSRAFVTADSGRPPRKCSQCGTMHYRKHYWCNECFRAKHGWEGAWGPSKPPPPPPGFNERDLTLCRPVTSWPHSLRGLPPAERRPIACCTRQVESWVVT